MKRKTKKPLSKFQESMRIKRERVKLQEDLVEECHALWQEVVKKKAGYKSEFSGLGEPIVGHHLFRDGNYPATRYNPDNGVCLTKGEHFKVHQQGELEINMFIREKRGQEWYDNLLRCKIDNANVQYTVEVLQEIKTGLTEMLK